MIHWLREKLGFKACPQCQTLVDFAMDGLPEGQQDTVREHLDQCPPCREQVRDYLQVREGLSLCSKQTEAPRDLCDKVLARLKEDPAQGLGAAPAAPALHAGAAGWPRFWMIFGPAFAVLGLVMTLVAFMGLMGGKAAPLPSAPADELSSLAAAIMDDPHSAHVTLAAAKGAADASGFLVLRPGLDHAYLHLEHLPAAPAGAVDTIWVSADQAPPRALASFVDGAGPEGTVQLLQLNGVFSGKGAIEFTVARGKAGSEGPGLPLLTGSLSL